MSCNGNCQGCGGCGGCGALTLTEPEVEMLLELGSIPFLPVARKAGDMIPRYFEDARFSEEESSLILQHLEQKGLISLDYDQPLTGSYGPAYDPYPVRGSMALTLRGQQVVELLQVQGIAEP